MTKTICMDKNASYKKTNIKLIHFPGKKNRITNNDLTLLSSESFNTYVNLFSFRGRVELFVFPTLPTRCIAETMTMHK